MPVEKDLSIVADSTVSSSPPTAPVKRPARTYGRPKDPTSEQTLPSSFHSSNSNSDTHFIRKASSDAHEEVSTSLGLSHSSADIDSADDDGDDVNHAPDASSKFPWAWREKILQIDDDEDIDESEKRIPVFESSGEGSSHAVPREPLFDLQGTSHNTHIPTPTSPLCESTDISSRDVFGSSLTTLTASSPARSSPARSVSPPTIQKRVSRRARLDSNDPESEHEDAQSSYSSSPAKHTINTPRSRSSLTPPTSEPEMPRQSRKLSSKGKAAVSAGRELVPPLLFESEQSDVHKTAGSKGKRTKSGKTKAPTKKELRDTALVRQRMNAEKEVSIPRTEARKALTLTNFFNDIKIPRAASLKAANSFSSDPISEFSSPAHITRTDSTTSISAGPSQSQTPQIPAVGSLDQDGDEDEFPEPLELAKERNETKLDRLQALNETKRRILAQQRQQQLADDSDDDLEIVETSGTRMQVVLESEAEARKTGKKRDVSEGQKMQRQFRGPTFIRATGSGRGAGILRTKADWDKALLEKANAEATEQVRRKEEEWVRRGGTLPAGRLGEQIPESHERQSWVERGLQRANKPTTPDDNHEDEDEGDEDWSPSQRGSASPVHGLEEDGSGAEDEDAELEDQDITMVDEEQNKEEDESASQNDVVRRRSTRAVVASDDEDDEDENRIPQIPQIVHRHSHSSLDESTEEDGDKENNTRLMYDRSEDKENAAVVRHGFSSTRPALGERQSSLFNLEEYVERGLSMSPGDRAMLSDEGDDEKLVRSPLKPLRAEASLSLSPIPFAARLQRAASAASLASGDASSEPQPTPSLAPLISPVRKNLGFSQFSEGGSEDPAPKVLQAGFSDLFESGTEKQLSQFPSRQPVGNSPRMDLFKKRSTSALSDLRRHDSLDLTQDVGLQPALQVDERLKRKADSIFEEEQEYLLEAVNEDVEKKPELYIDKHGFLTQTRPDSSPEIYRPPPTPSQPYSQNLYALQSQRQPFRELSMTDSYFDFMDKNTPAPSNTGLRRLVKRGDSSVALQSGYSRTASTPTPPASPSDRRQPQRQKNAFELLGQKEKPRRRLEKSEFVEGEAEESDEDEMFGFRTKKDDEGEEDGEDLDQTLDTLVDDKEMDESAVAAEKVLEKYQEHLEGDDAELQKYHMAAVQGEMRRKRKNMMGIDDSDEEEDEDERNRKIRRKMKEHKIRDDIESLGKHPETKAFYETYAKGINDEGDPELEYLMKEDEPVDMKMRTEADVPGQSDAEDGDDNENDENSGPGSISRDEFVRQVRELAQADEDEEVLDPNDTSWVDAAMDLEEEDGNVRVKDISRQHLPRRSRLDPLEYEGGSEVRYASHMIDEANRSRSASWVKNESRMKRMGNARSVGGAAVTGHGPKKAWRGPSSTAVSSKPASVVKATSSMLKAVDRSDRFK